MAVPFVFFDLRTPDVAASRAFYAQLFGWVAADGPMPMLTDGGAPWAGFTPLAPDDARRPQWVPYAPVDDLDQATGRAVALGATLVRGRTELPVGSLTVIEDPAGATIVLWEARRQ
ncbi:VOC family protein [Actinoplanes sp. NPDC051411]|uniref:VOC family protein n=1 Tax=Actinoplanes sp. NPDC051411 TaxID=3155522 RepID=UPI0034275062